MSFSWRHGAALGALLAVGVAGAIILAQTPPDRVTVRSAASSDDVFGFDASPPPAPRTEPTSIVPNTELPTTTLPPELTEEELSVSPIATYTCARRTGDAKRPIQCNGSAKVHGWLTITFRKKLPAPATITLEEYAENPEADDPGRAIGRYVRLSSTLNPAHAKGVVMRIVYTATDVRGVKNGARALAIAAYDAAAGRWTVLPSAVNLRGKFVQASFATRRLPEQLFALVTKPQS